MNPTYDQVRMVKQDWSSLRNIQPHIIGDVFFGKLFFDHPQFKNSFDKMCGNASGDDPNECLVGLVGSVVARLDAPDDIRRVLEVWVKNVRSPAISEGVFVKLSACLIWTLQSAFGNEWNHEKETAWNACLAIVGWHIIVR